MSRKSGIKPLLTYLFKDEEKLHSKIHEPFVIRKNVRTRSLEKWVKEFEVNEALRQYKRKDAVKAYHTVLSFNGKDRQKMSTPMLKDITRKYMNLRGKDALYIAAVHYDRSHIHIHIAESGTKYKTGKANRLSKKEFRELKIAMATYQKKKYPELINSLPDHGRTAVRAYKAQNSRESRKEALHELLSTSWQDSTTLDEFLDTIKQAGHEPYYRNSQLTGIKYMNGQKFRLSRLGYGKEKLQERYDRSKKELAELRELQTIRDRSVSHERELGGRTRDFEEEKETLHSDESDE